MDNIDPTHSEVSFNSEAFGYFDSKWLGYSKKFEGSMESIFQERF